jgi:antagonist of KipI
VIEVLKPGLFSTVQDLGRSGYQQYGMVVSGAMDAFALQIGNLLLGNPVGEAGLEITMIGPLLKAHTNLLIAVTGADLGAEIDGCSIPLWKSLWWEKGSLLSFRGPLSGARAYITIQGGIQVPEVLGSKSTYIAAQMGGFLGRPLQKGDRLSIGNMKKDKRPHMKRFLSPTYVPPYQSKSVRVILGPHQDAFTKRGIQTFLTSEYECTPNSDRMGARFKGEPIEHRSGADILSCAVTFGSIQVPADGQPIILLADRQTTGGYTQIATVISVDLPLIAQLLPGESVNFQEISITEAQQLAVEQARLLQKLRSYQGK